MDLGEYFTLCVTVMDRCSGALLKRRSDHAITQRLRGPKIISQQPIVPFRKLRPFNVRPESPEFLDLRRGNGQKLEFTVSLKTEFLIVSFSSFPLSSFFLEHFLFLIHRFFLYFSFIYFFLFPILMTFASFFFLFPVPIQSFHYC